MSKILGPEVGYTDLLDIAIEEAQKQDTKARFPLRPSASGYCGRRLAYDLMEYRGKAKYEKEILPANIYRLLSLGHSVEYSAIKHFQLLKFVDIKYKQQTVTLFRLDPIGDKPQELIEGQVDLVLWSPEYKCVMDVKSAKDGFSSGYATRWDEKLDSFRRMSSLKALSSTAFYAEDLDAFLEESTDEFLADNLIQLNSYCCTEFFAERGVDHGVILKYNKNDSRQYELRFKPSRSVFEKVRDKFNRVNKAVDQGKPEEVAKDAMLGSMKCSFCPYSKLCWPEIDAKKEFFKTLPKKKWPTDTSRLGNLGTTLEEMFADYHNLMSHKSLKEKLEERILKMLVDKKINKLKLDNGVVYEVKYLKSPRPHYELRRSKL